MCNVSLQNLLHREIPAHSIIFEQVISVADPEEEISPPKTEKNDIFHQFFERMSKKKKE